MIIAFTGTQHGMTQTQKQTVAYLLRNYKITRAVHGDCVGADAEFHELMLQYNCTLASERRAPFTLRPGCDARGESPKRAYCDRTFDNFIGTVHEPEPYLVRNKKIAADGDVLLAAPVQEEEQRRGSGTWSTIRSAAKLGKTILIVYPTGRVGTYVKK